VDDRAGQALDGIVAKRNQPELKDVEMEVSKKRKKPDETPL
jgi:hypothetical protein